MSTTQGGATTTLLSNAAYSGIGGSFGEMTGATLGGTTFGASYDLLDRATDLNVKRTSDNATIFDQARTFAAAGNVSTINTTLPTGTDNQAFCYDEQPGLPDPHRRPDTRCAPRRYAHSASPGVLAR